MPRAPDHAPPRKPGRAASASRPSEGGEHHRGSKAESLLALLRRLRAEGELGNAALLLGLYTLQGVPMGLSQVVPLILAEHDVPLTLYVAPPITTS